MEIGTHTQTEEGKGEKTIAWERAEIAGQWDQGSDQKLAWKEKLQVKEAQELETGTESSKGRPRQEGEKNKQQKQFPKKTRTKIPLEKGPNLLASRARNGGEHYHPTHAQ